MDKFGCWAPTGLVVCMLLGGTSGESATVKLPPPQRVTSAEGITEYRLANGLRVLLFPDASKPSITVNMTYLVGSRHEHYGETGMAHLLEHLMFKPSAKYSGEGGAPKPVDVLNGVGARFNGTTSYDRTNYFVSFPAREENLEKVLDLEADRMVHARIAQKDLWDGVAQKGEMSVVRNEFESGENDPINVTFERTLSAAFIWHNYGKSTIGARSDIERVDIGRLRAFYRTYYQPDNAVLLVAGKIDAAKTLARINAHFGPIPRPSREIPKTYTLEPPQDGERLVTVRRVGDIQAVMAAYKIPAGAASEYAAFQVLAQILSDQPSGRLYKALVETRKATSVFSYVFPGREPGFAVFGAQAEKGADQGTVREGLIAALEGMAAAPVTPEEVERARQALLKQIRLALLESDRLAIRLSEFIAQGDWRLFFLNRDRIQQVTAAEVQKAATAYLKAANRTVGQFIPSEKPERVEIPAAPEVADMVKNYRGQGEPVQGEAFDAAPGAIDARTQTHRLSSGLKVALLSKRTRGASVQLALNLHLGSEQTLWDKGAIPELAAGMLSRGTVRHSRQQLKDELDRLQAQISFTGTDEQLQVSLLTVREHLPAALRMMAEMLREPVFPTGELATLVQEETGRLEEQRSDPMALGALEMQRYFSSIYPKGHPRYVATLEESLASLRSVKREDLEAFHRAFYGASAGELALVGDFDAAGAKALLEELLGNWHAATPYVRIPTPCVQPPAMNRILNTPDKANAFFLAEGAFPMADRNADYPAFLMANYLLGGGALRSRLADRLRQQDGLSYRVGTQFTAHPQDEAATWICYAICNPANMGRVETGFREEVVRALKGGFTQEEIQEGKQAWLQAQAQRRTQDGELASRLAWNLRLGRTFAQQGELEQRVAALTAGQILEALQKHLDLLRVSVVKAGDFKPVAGASR